ncbi:hypothetical protein [Miltoncostaea oceani]|uniref:hypothetical protein n=1 Tax=Miltoncostaea oceani TaxID=2843216 RepID=UPI001C3D70D3|nr:hypothetical protein [Miltoncostaea oceani]
MGVAFLCTVARIDEDRAPDWAAAQEAIEAFSIETLAEEDDRDPSLYVFNDVTDEQARASLASDLADFRSEIEGPGPMLAWVVVGGSRIYITGGMSYGDEPNELFGSMVRLEECGVLSAAGFTNH